MQLEGAVALVRQGWPIMAGMHQEQAGGGGSITLGEAGRLAKARAESNVTCTAY